MHTLLQGLMFLFPAQKFSKPSGDQVFLDSKYFLNEFWFFLAKDFMKID